MRRWARLLGLSIWVAGAGALASGCAPEFTSHADREHQVALSGQSPQPARLNPPTIVSLNPCIDAMLVEIAAPAQILSLSHYSYDPASTSMDVAAARRYPANGGTVEEVLALNPDLVVASDFLAPATHAALIDLGIAVETFGIASNVEDGAAQARQMGAATGRREQGDALAEQITASARSILADDPAAAPISTVLWQPGGIVAGEEALIGDLLRRAGFTSQSAARGLGQADYLPLEQVIADPPELLLIAGDSAGQNHPALSAVPEMERRKFDPSLLYCGGPTIPKAMERLRQIREELR